MTKFWLYEHVGRPLQFADEDIENLRKVALDLKAQVGSYCTQKGER